MPPAPNTEPLPDIEPTKLYPIPDAHTVTEFLEVNLLKLNFSINTHLHVAVCRQCHAILSPPSTITLHVLSHLKHATMPDNFLADLMETHELRTEPQFPSFAIPPVYGLAIHPKSLYFCSECHRGYTTVASFTSHQNHSHHDCPYYVAYGQAIQTANTRRFIPISLDDVPTTESISFDFLDAFTQSITPRRVPAETVLSLPEDTMSFQSFYYTDGWLLHLKDHTPSALEEARRLHKTPGDDSHPLDQHGAVLRCLAQNYLSSIQPHIAANANYGLLSQLGQTKYVTLSSQRVNHA